MISNKERSPTPPLKTIQGPSKVDCMRRIFLKLQKLNDILKDLENDILRLRAAVSLQDIQHLTKETSYDSELWWFRELQKALKIYHFHAQFSIQFLCNTYCKNE